MHIFSGHPARAFQGHLRRKQQKMSLIDSVGSCGVHGMALICAYVCVCVRVAYVSCVCVCVCVLVGFGVWNMCVRVRVLHVLRVRACVPVCMILQSSLSGFGIGKYLCVCIRMRACRIFWYTCMYVYVCIYIYHICVLYKNTTSHTLSLSLSLSSCLVCVCVCVCLCVLALVRFCMHTRVYKSCMDGTHICMHAELHIS
jgi:hypothetical protein